MCLQCHPKSNENALLELQEIIKNSQFEKWNPASLNHVLLFICGLNGKECHDLGCELAEMFFKWYLGYTYGLWQVFFTYSKSIFLFPHSSVIREQINSAKQFYDTNKHKSCEEKQDFLNNKYSINKENWKAFEFTDVF